MASDTTSFAYLFKKYRLLSGFATIGDFADALAEEGFICDESLISKWQRGVRVPNREAIATLLKIFSREGGIDSISEANQFLEATGLSQLTKLEMKGIFPDTGEFKDTSWRIEEIERTCQYIRYFSKQSKRLPKKVFNDLIIEQAHNLHLIFQKCCEFRLYDDALKIWDYINDYLWNSGKWKELQLIGEKTISIAKVLNKKEILAKILIKRISWLYYWQGELKKAEKALLEGEEILLSFNDSYLKNLATLRRGKILTGNTAEIANSLSESKNFFGRRNMDKEAGDALTYLGEIYWSEGKLAQSEEIFELAIRHAKKIRDFDQSSIVFTRMGGIALEKEQLDLANQFFEKSMDYENKGKRRVGAMLWNNVGLGLIESKKARKDLMHAYFEKAKFEQNLLGINNKARKTILFLKKFEKELTRLGFFVA